MIRRVRKPKKRPEKWEKAAIMKQLLALSEREERLAGKVPSARLRTAAPRPGMRPVKAGPKTPARTALPVHTRTH
jgi:hypothetical protein